MAYDIMSQFYTSLNLPLQEKLLELTRIIDQSSPNKDLQALFPQLISNIFSPSLNNGWGLRTVTCDINRYDFDALISFFEPLGPMFRLCYKLLSDPQLKYNLPLNVLPLDLKITLERGRCPQFYADMLTTDSQSLNVVALALNPFDYYILNFALHLVNNSQNKSTWENWNSVYFALACDYLMHFLPADPNVTVLPSIPHYTGKVPMVAPLQTANRPLYSPSLLLIPDLSGSSMSNQHTAQNQSRNEVWRSETVLQVFIDIWMSVEQFNARNVELYQRNYQIICSSPERVRTVRVLVKHLHTFSAKHLSDPAVRSSALRKYARQMMCVRAYHYIKHLVTTWPLDASFRLVMELWLSFIQPWRYVNNTISQDRFPATNNNQEDATNTLDASFTQFIAENFPSYTCIFQLVLPRFMRLDLTAYKNAVMLFRLGKVFSQQHLVPILRNLEQGITDSGSGSNSPDVSFNNSVMEQSYTYNGVPLHKWVTIAKQAISELNLSANYEYEAMWGENTRHVAAALVKRIVSAKMTTENSIQEFSRRINLRNQGIWAGIKNFLMIGSQDEDELILEESKKVPTYLNTSIHHFSNIFGLNENVMHMSEPIIEDNSLEHSSYVNSTSFPLSITNKLRTKPTAVQYMGDPDLMPITSYESTILVRMLYQMASRLNEIYGSQFTRLWNRNDLWGYMAREVLQRPCSIQSYVRDITNHQNIVSQELPPRLSLRRLGSHAFVIWVTIGYFIFRLFSFSGLFYIFILVLVWITFVFTKASSKMLRLI
ncbi:sphingomyelin phosphodiesterase 4 [Anticarsia gemmatalis]|uniref:sphingomyelin phosphodiesterase 4 n=1 Tax=Anticarsia gemmatalis TaxID=129554 RepID=UPI003F75FC94